jgi:hypothetical protein
VKTPPRQECGKLSNGRGRYLASVLESRSMLHHRSARPELTPVGVKPQVRQLKYAPLAQSAERLHGKEKVYGSIP